eukprot:TRINITY_DN17029_c1_g1_i3.p3 TRINITY_DN17029_c1_g1~~TRINITY_DN17029_c1_g1_i3.p3  ORF type:complete len:176 (-),score=17.29 TRINITY_DN17029_c1_g1_i3:616-1143(-)
MQGLPSGCCLMHNIYPRRGWVLALQQLKQSSREIRPAYLNFKLLESKFEMWEFVSQSNAGFTERMLFDAQHLSQAGLGTGVVTVEKKGESYNVVVLSRIAKTISRWFSGATSEYFECVVCFISGDQTPGISVASTPSIWCTMIFQDKSPTQAEAKILTAKVALYKSSMQDEKQKK